jgi:flagellar basal-body rod modification protein FlgD
MSIAAPSSSNGSGALDSLSNMKAPGSDMDKQEFLELLVMQLSNQDPMDPQDPSEFTAQLTQFSSLEQLASIREGLDMMAITQTSATHASMVQFVGKNVEFADNSIQWDGTESEVDLTYSLGGRAESVTIMVQDDEGNQVKTIELGPQEAGMNKISFDGVSEHGLKLPPGEYTFSVSARTADETTVEVNTLGAGLVESVTFEKGYPELIMTDGRRVDLGKILTVSSFGDEEESPIDAIVGDSDDDKPTEHAPINEE